MDKLTEQSSELAAGARWLSDSGLASSTFARALLKTRGTSLFDFARGIDERFARRVLEDYGALFVASDEVRVPPSCVFADEAEVVRFQREAGWEAADLSGALIELQPAALRALLAARSEAQADGREITPRGGSEAARRSFADTLRLWESRVLPALDHWTACCRLDPEEAALLRAAPLAEQITAVLDLEERGLFFSKDFAKSIFYSVAPPGTSQHLSLLAFDVTEFRDERVRGHLARHGWHQTVRSDLPHFTYLGLTEEELPARGLTKVEEGGQIFWIPRLAP